MLEDGVIVQSGTHRELMEYGGSYKRLFEYQHSLESYAQQVGSQKEWEKDMSLKPEGVIA